MRKCFYSFCCCISKPKDQGNITTPTITAGQPSHSGIQHFPSQHNDFYDFEMYQQQLPLAKLKALAVIKSKFTKEEILSSEDRKKFDGKLKYYCPICFKYFDKILTTDCCKHYICHSCVAQMNQKATECPFCNKSGFELTDVNLEETIRQYTDTPLSSIGFQVVKGRRNSYSEGDKEEEKQVNQKKLHSESSFPRLGDFSIETKDRLQVSPMQGNMIKNSYSIKFKERLNTISELSFARQEV